MPWWFWIITHVWAVSITIIATVAIHEDEYSNIEDWKQALFMIAIHIFAPLAVLIGLIVVLWQNVIENKVRKWIEHSRFKTFFKSRKIKEEKRKQSKKDFKELEDNEDEWRIERLGIKSRY